MQTFHRDRKRWRRRNIRYGSWLRDNALTRPATVHDPVNVVRHGRSEQFFPVGRSGAASESSCKLWLEIGTQWPPPTTYVLVTIVRDAQSVLIYAHDRGIDHLH